MEGMLGMVDLERLMDARQAYRDANAHYDETVQEVIQRAEQNGSLSKADIGAICFWKRLNANTKWVARLQQLSDSQVRAVTRQAMKEVRDDQLTLEESARRGRETLRTLPGCGHGNAVPSALLFALAPQRMAVYDRRALEGLRVLGLPQEAPYSKYMALLGDLASQLAGQGTTWLPRDVDIALFWLGGE